MLQSVFRDKGNKAGDDDCLLMKAGEDKILQRKEIKTPDRTFLLLLTERDLGVQYPGMIMCHSLRILSGDTEIARFATNTYEYPPSSPIRALGVVQAKADEWERELSQILLNFRPGTRSGGSDHPGKPRLLKSWSCREARDRPGTAA